LLQPKRAEAVGPAAPIAVAIRLQYPAWADS